MAAEMFSVTAPGYTDPSGYELSTVPRPTVKDKTDVVIRVHAASVNPVDVKKADGVFKLAVKER
jgi:NADPH:quinone reductase-like Zn-dependent oxidoreductase